jgi:hypothetical protein
LLIFSPVKKFAYKTHRQMPSTKLKPVADPGQLSLLPSHRPDSADDVSIATIVRRTTLLRAIHLAQEVSGLEDKQIYDALGIDKGHWSRMKSGDGNFPVDERFVNYLNIVGNEIPLIWLAEKRGYDWGTIRKHCSELERENEELKKELADHRRAVRLLVEARGNV